jgi:hypothetical protein|tara:strand:+ start:370 stop:528 length:159 start_codon:yes stop_codon:yes gene_type:complete
MNIDITNEERYEFIKLYDILRDMDFELTDNQVSVFEQIQEQENSLKTLCKKI